MAQPIVMPKLGQMTEESTVVRWLKQEGEAVAKGEPLLEIETDKAVMEVESFYDGVLLKILIQEGETVPVMQTLAFVGAPGETVDEDLVSRESGSSEAVPASATATGQDLRPPAAGESGREPDQPDRLRISPRAAGLALAHGIDARRIHGSGPGGRIIERDVLTALQRGPFERAAAPAPTLETGRPLSRIRQIIGERLTRSFTSVPHFYVTVAVDMTAVEKIRADLKARSVQISVTDFLVKAAALALVDFPDCNSRIDGNRIMRRSGVHIGLAVALEEGLVAPVIRDADRLSLSDIAALARGLAEKAKSGKLKPEEMSGGSFTISNLGMLQVDSFTAIINPGESAILAVGSMTPQPAALAQRVEIRQILKMTLSADHRLIDGALAARFVNRIRERLEDYQFWRAETVR
jgi:pyruvate dehydrogenase E2 component (dihydrolipoamide acetyltransferase)